MHLPPCEPERVETQIAVARRCQDNLSPVSKEVEQAKGAPSVHLAERVINQPERLLARGLFDDVPFGELPGEVRSFGLSL